MVGKIIRDYIGAGNKKLTVPGFGTFMRKDSGEIIFVDLLRKDDGVLRGLVEEYGNYSEVEAMALVDRFIFGIKHGIERNGSAAIEGFGTMTLDDKGLYQFDYSAQPAPVREKPVQESLFPPKSTLQQRPQQPSPAPKPRPAGARPASPQPARRPAQQARPAARPTRKPAKGKPAKIDMWIVIAIVAAVIAIVIIVYGLSGSSLPFLQ